MRVSESGKEFIRLHEGEVLKVYLDQAGLPTFGIGHLLTDEEKAKYPVGAVITKEVSRRYFEKDLDKHSQAIHDLVRVPLNQNQFDAVSSLIFNIGVGKVNPKTGKPNGFLGSSVLRHLNNGDYEKAADAFLVWNKTTINKKKVVSKGLDRRRKEERALFLTPSEAGAVHPPGPVEDPPSTITPPPSITPETLPDTVEVPKHTEIAAPKETGGTDKVKGYSWKLPALGTIATFVISTVESLVNKGYFDAKDVGEKLYVFFVVNWRYAVYLGIAAIGYLAIKKILSVIPPLIEAVTEARPDLQAVRFTKDD